MSMTGQTTFGSHIAQARKRLAISQKELASKVLREDGQPISPQYSNDRECPFRAASAAF